MTVATVPNGVVQKEKRFVGPNGGLLLARKGERYSLARPDDFGNGTRLYEKTTGLDPVNGRKPVLVAVVKPAIVEEWAKLPPLDSMRDGDKVKEKAQRLEPGETSEMDKFGKRTQENWFRQVPAVEPYKGNDDPVANGV